MRKILLLILVISLLFVPDSQALNLSRVKEWSAAEILTAADLNAEFDNVLNHDIANADISATAAIVASKIDLTTASAIGSTTPSTGAFTTLSNTGAFTMGSKLTAGANEIEGSAFDINGGTVDAITTLTVANAVDIGSFALTALKFASDQTTGTAPLTVASTTKVTNLNADLLDGYNSSSTAAATVVYVSDASNHLPVDSFATDIDDYGTSASTATGKELGSVIICYGTVTVGASTSQAITNLPFTSNTSYAIICTFSTTTPTFSNDLGAVKNTGAQATIYNGHSSEIAINWIAIGT